MKLILRYGTLNVLGFTLIVQSERYSSKSIGTVPIVIGISSFSLLQTHLALAKT